MPQESDVNFDFFSKNGKRGGKKLLRKRGKKYFQEIAKKRWSDKTNKK